MASRAGIRESTPQIRTREQAVPFEAAVVSPRPVERRADSRTIGAPPGRRVRLKDTFRRVPARGAPLLVEEAAGCPAGVQGRTQHGGAGAHLGRRSTNMSGGGHPDAADARTKAASAATNALT